MSGVVKTKLTKAQRTFLEALRDNGRLSASTGNPPVMLLAKAGLFRFVHRAEDFCTMEITPAGRAALQEAQP